MLLEEERRFMKSEGKKKSLEELSELLVDRIARRKKMDGQERLTLDATVTVSGFEYGHLLSFGLNSSGPNEKIPRQMC